MSTVLVTGGNGFIGSYVIDDLKSRGYSTLSLDHTRHDTPHTAEVILGDIRDATAVNEAMAHADGWIHLAGVLGTQETIQNPLPAAETNVMGGLNVLEAATQYELPGVCIAVGNHWMNNTYSITKTTIERFCEMYRDERGLRVSVVRALNAYGPRQSVARPYGPSKVRKIMPAFICRALTGAPIEVYGTGDQVMDMIYVADVAKVLADAYEFTSRVTPIPHVLSVGTGRHTTVQQIAEAVIEAAGSGEIINMSMRPGEPPDSVVVGDPVTLDVLYGQVWDWDLVTLEEGVKVTVDWYRKHWLPTYKEQP